MTSTGKFESGISVYECEDAGEGKWRGTGPAFAKREQRYRGQQRKLLGDVNTTWYLVTGEPVGIGGDKEPLVKNVTPLKTVVWDKVEFFQQGAVVQNPKYNNHPEFPDCTCETTDDIVDSMEG